MNNPLDIKAPAPLLELRNVQRSYLQGTVKLDVLNNASLSVRAGEMKALVGPSGSGKSTLLNVAGLLERPDAGEVLIDGVDAGKLGRAKRGNLRRSHIGFVFQFHRLLPEFSALENVSMPLLIRGESIAAAKSASQHMLEKVGLKERVEHKPSELSGGERQRVAIARALVTQPRCVLLDEPTGNLDRSTALEIQALMADLNNTLQTSFVVVTHSEELAGAMSRQLTIRDGCLVE